MDNKNELFNCYQAKDVWESTHFNNIRKAILNNDYQSYCSKCPFVLGNTQFPEKYECSNNINVEHITLSIDPSCNLSCKSCRSDKIPENPFADSIFSSTMVFSDTITTVNIAGDGEIFASKFYMQLLQNDLSFVYPNIKYLELHTNGTLFNRINYEKINESNRNKITKIIISIDAASEDVYRNVRGYDFNKLIKNIEFIRTLNIPIESYFTISNLNKHDCINFIELTKTLGITKTFFWHIRDWGRNDYLSLRLNDTELALLKNDINKYCDNNNIFNVFTCM